MKKSLFALSLFGLLLPLAACGPTTSSAFVFKQWNSCESLNTLKAYVEDVTNEKSKNFIPKKDRIATFDMDGTIYGELYPTYLEYAMLRYRALKDDTYTAPDDVKAAAQTIQDYYDHKITSFPSGFDLTHAHAAAKAYSGMTLKEFDEYAKKFLKTPCWGFDNLTYGESFYQPMLEVFDYLDKNDFTYYVVSGSDRFLCRALLCDSIGIPSNRIIGMDVELKAKNQGDVDPLDYVYGQEGDDLLRTENLLIKNLKLNKVRLIAKEIGKIPVLSFGNSDGDCSMHNYAMSNPTYKSATFMLVADDDSRDYANLEKGAKREAEWRKNHYTVISMKNDFKTIYKEGAKKSTPNA